MSYTGQDDYNNDIKPDNTCQPLPDAISCIDWVPSNMGTIFCCSCWDVWKGWECQSWNLDI